MNDFLEALRVQRWDDHRYYHHSRINQSLHLVSAISFLFAYVMVLKDPAIAAGSSHCSPERIRTAASALRGRRPRPLDDGAGTVSSGLGGEDSNPQRQDQNLLCCRLHHPRRNGHGTESRHELAHAIGRPRQTPEPDDAANGDPQRLAEEPAPLVEARNRAAARG